MIREGQMVGFMCPVGKKRRLLVCLVHRWDGVDDHLVELVTERCLHSGGRSIESMAYTYHTELIPVDAVNRRGEVIVSRDHAGAIEHQILEFLLTKAGKRMLEKPKREKVGAPEKGRGKLQRADIPDRLAKGFSSALSTSFEARIGDGGARTWSLGCLKNRNEPMYHVYVDRETYGYSFKEIAVRRNVTENHARQIYHRARIDLRELSFFYPVAMKTERIQAAAA